MSQSDRKSREIRTHLLLVGQRQSWYSPRNIQWQWSCQPAAAATRQDERSSSRLISLSTTLNTAQTRQRICFLLLCDLFAQSLPPPPFASLLLRQYKTLLPLYGWSMTCFSGQNYGRAWSCSCVMAVGGCALLIQRISNGVHAVK